MLVWFICISLFSISITMLRPTLAFWNIGVAHIIRKPSIINIQSVRCFSISAHPSKAIQFSKKTVNAKLNDKVKVTNPTKLDSLSSESTVDTVIRNLKEFRKGSSSKKMLRMLEDAEKYGLMTLNVTREALKTLQFINQTEVGKEVYELFQQNPSHAIELSTDLTNTVYLVKWFCRTGNMELVETVFDKIGLILKPSDINLSCIKSFKQGFQEAPEMQEFHHLVYNDLLMQAALGYATQKQFQKSLFCLETMAAHDMLIDLEISKKILKILLKESDTQQALQAVQLLLDLNGIYEQDSLQIAVNTFMRNIDFVKGAVSMETLPPEEYGEVAFIGRSNVGKSSLINAISNRKNLAYTSKTAGKTSEFNYFLVTGNVGAMKETPKFYLIDLPGVGYAQRSKSTRSTWTTLMDRYTKERSTLRCIFHLIDSRHGVMEADDECFQLLESLPRHVQYVVVFTKVDKLRGLDAKRNDALLPISPAVYHDVRKRIQNFTTREIPMLFSSSETKFGALSVLNTALKSVADLSLPDHPSQSAVTLGQELKK